MIGGANAGLPFGSIKNEELQGTASQISFDPLALLAILHSPRAAASAARFHHQNDLELYRWPHTMMVGGALPPFKLLVDHLLSQTQSLHPAIEMYKADTGTLDIVSNLGFSTLPVSYSNIWLSDLLAFRPSSSPMNDILIVDLESISGTKNPAINPRMQRMLLDLIGATTSALLLVGVAFSVLVGDLWSATLFGTYLIHALVSAAVSFRCMINTTDQRGRRVRTDATVRYAVHQRAAGGKGIFRGRQDTLETWCRTSWAFRRTAINDALHWLWMLTGTLSAATSVICMVNMAGYLQLAYLGTLIISSVGEILATQLVRRIQHTAIHYGESHVLTGNEFWSRAVVRAALEVEDRFALAELPWMEVGLFPDYRVFRNLCGLLPELRRSPRTKTADELVQELCAAAEVKHRPLAQRIAREIVDAQNAAMGRSTQVPAKVP